MEFLQNNIPVWVVNILILFSIFNEKKFMEVQ